MSSDDLTKQALEQEVRAAIRAGLASGDPVPFDAEKIKAQGRKRLLEQRLGVKCPTN